MRGARCLKGMNKREEIKRIWSECFDDSPEYVDMYFDRVYNDADGMTLERGGRVVSSLLLQKYRLMVQRSEVGMSYIAGAGTRRNARGNGYMSALIVEALGRSATRGDAVCALIPANDRLYSYYKRFGFTTVFMPMSSDIRRCMHSVRLEKLLLIGRWIITMEMTSMMRLGGLNVKEVEW